MRRGCVCLELDDGCRTRCAPMWWPLETADEAGVDVGSVSVGSLARLGSQCRCGIHRIRPRGNFPDLSIRPWVGHSRSGTPDRPRTDIEAHGSRRDDLSDDRHGVDAGAAARARRYPRGGASQNRGASERRRSVGPRGRTSTRRQPPGASPRAVSARSSPTTPRVSTSSPGGPSTRGSTAIGPSPTPTSSRSGRTASHSPSSPSACSPAHPSRSPPGRTRYPGGSTARTSRAPRVSAPRSSSSTCT